MTPHPRCVHYFAAVSDTDAPTVASTAETSDDASRACERVALSRRRAIHAPAGFASVRDDVNRRPSVGDI